MLFRRIRDLREDRDLTQEMIAQYLNITQPAYSDYERGVTLIPVDMLIRLCDFYQVSLDYIVGRSEAPNGLPGISPPK